MNKFEKVSLEQFKKDTMEVIKNSPTIEDAETFVKSIYEKIKLPQRATKGSAGYDFYSPFAFILNKDESIIIPTGIRARLDKNKFLAIYPRSGHGFKYRSQLDNTVGIIDSDYYYSSNEGHILLKITCDSKTPGTKMNIEIGSGFAQGIIQQYFTSIDDNADSTRDGGIGSTDK
ncbi:deoxyuridine 5'-triphosphate nucleotidohydrolase [Lachnospiraceae bacterium NSJ-143]|nr:deoxyuridine 5'-triphosphate nucleotidohydrolase [Lachnospiraceae bacterium NSJ-143]